MPSPAEPNQTAIAPTGSAEPFIAHLAAFLNHTSAGDSHAALAAATLACEAAPHRPEPHMALGRARLKLNEYAAAEESFREALRLTPNLVDGWILFGICLNQRSAVLDAKQAMREALRLAPDNPIAAANLAALMRLTGEPDAAETLSRRVVENAPHNVGARLNLVSELLVDERPADALALLDAAPSVPTEPSLLRYWHLRRALVMLQLRRPAEARAEAEALAAMGPIPPEIAPGCLWVHVQLAAADGDEARTQRTAVAMERALEAEAPGADPEARIEANYRLGNFWARRHRPAAAFRFWTQGHKLLAKSQPFTRAAHLETINASIAAFPRSRFEAGPVASNRDPGPVFIAGMPRSGTTLCEQIIGAHPMGFGAGERPAIGQLAWRTGDPGAIAALDTEALDAAAGTFLTDLYALAPGASRIADKMPANYLHLGLIGLMLPGAKIIHCVRDPRDIGLSIFTFRFLGMHGYAHDIADLGWTIAQQDRLMRHWKDVMPGRILTVRLNDWIEDFDTTLRRVLAHTGLPYDPACERFYEQETRVRTVSRNQVRQPINASGLGRWKAYAAELQPLIAELDQAGMLAEWEGTP
jgi:tetratricopeptide (TPR) repeat protein